MRKDIFLLDMDDTLLDFPRAERVNLTETLGKFGIRADGEVAARFHAINDGLWKALERGEVGRERLKERRFELLFGEFGFTANVPAVARAYFERFADICFPFEGAEDFLRELARLGSVYIVTNGGAGIQRRHIELAGFSPYLDGVFISEELGANKPSAAYAEGVKRAIPGFCCERALWIGDSLTSDMKCAEQAGVDFLLFAPHGVPAGYEGEFASDYGQVLGFLKRIQES